MVSDADAALRRLAAHGQRDPRELVVGYDHCSDRLTAHAFGRGIPAVSGLVGDDERDLFLLRVEPTTNRPVRIQIEGFTASFAEQLPELAAPLDVTELRGIGCDEIHTFHQQLAHDRPTP